MAHENEHIPGVVHCLHEGDMGMFKQAIIHIEKNINNTNEKLDKIYTMMERQGQLEEKTRQIESTLSVVDERLRSVETNIAKLSGGSVWSNKILWWVFIAIAGSGAISQLVELFTVLNGAK